MRTRTLTFGSTKIEITEPAFIALIATIILFAASLTVAFLRGDSIGGLIFVIVMAAVLIPYITYAVNCVIVGKCIKLSWFLAILYLVVASINVLALIMMLMYSPPVASKSGSGSHMKVLASAPIVYKGSFGKKA